MMVRPVLSAEIPSAIIFNSSNGKDIQYPKLAGKITAELITHGYTVNIDQSENACQSEIGIPATHDETQGAINVTKLYEQAKQHVVDGYYSETIESVLALISLRQKDPITFLSDRPAAADNRDKLRVSLLHLAHAYLRQNNMEKATAIMTDYILSFPKQPPSMITHSPDLHQFYASVLAKHNAKHVSSSLTILFNGEQPDVYINENRVSLDHISISNAAPGSQTMRLSGLPIGKIRIFVTSGNQARNGVIARSFCTELDAVKETKIRYNPSLYRRQKKQSGSAGPDTRFVYDNIQSYRKLSSLDQKKIAKQLNVEAVISLHFSQSAYIDFSFQNVDGKNTRLATLPIRMLRNDAALKEIIGYLITGLPLQSRYFRQQRAEHIDSDTVSSSKTTHVLAWTTLGLGLASIGAGIPILLKDGKGTDCDASGENCENLYDTKLPGWGLIGAGSALVATSIGLFIYTKTKKSSDTSQVATSQRSAKGNQHAQSVWMLTPYISKTNQGLSLTALF